MPYSEAVAEFFLAVYDALNGDYPGIGGLGTPSDAPRNPSFPDTPRRFVPFISCDLSTGLYPDTPGGPLLGVNVELFIDDEWVGEAVYALIYRPSSTTGTFGCQDFSGKGIIDDGAYAPTPGVELFAQVGVSLINNVCCKSVSGGCFKQTTSDEDGMCPDGL